MVTTTRLIYRRKVTPMSTCKNSASFGTFLSSDCPSLDFAKRYNRSLETMEKCKWPVDCLAAFVSGSTAGRWSRNSSSTSWCVHWLARLSQLTARSASVWPMSHWSASANVSGATDVIRSIGSVLQTYSIIFISMVETWKIYQEQ